MIESSKLPRCYNDWRCGSRLTVGVRVRCQNKPSWPRPAFQHPITTNEDAAFRHAMSELNFGPTAFDNQSLERDVTLISREEVGGAGGVLGGVAAVGPLVPGSLGCGTFAPVCAGGIALFGLIGGSVAEDELGGFVAEKAFDEVAQESLPGEIERLKEEIRELRQEYAEEKITVEDSAAPTGL